MPPGLKAEARTAVGEALVDQEWAAATVSVRVNGVATPWFEDDMRAITGCVRLDSVIVPKVESVADLEACERLLEAAVTDVSRRAPIGLQALIESAAGLQAAGEIAAGSPRLESLILGPADMSVSLGFPSLTEGPRWDFVRGGVLVAARAAGLSDRRPLPADLGPRGPSCFRRGRARIRLRRQVGSASSAGRADQRSLLRQVRRGLASRGDPRRAQLRDRRRSGDAGRRDDR